MRIVYFDSETTGTDPYSDRIVELALLAYEPDDEVGRSFNARVNPGVPIPVGASEVHGITDADVAGLPTFDRYAAMVQEIVQDAVLVGYNCRTFDTILLDAELRRHGQPGLPRDTAGRIAVPEVDLLQLWYRHEDRKLATAARRFAGVTLDDAHAAEADMRVLPDVLYGMCRAFGLDPYDTEKLCALSVPDGAIDRAGKFAKREDGQVVLTFGKHKDEPAVQHADFLEWMLRADFPPETKDIARVLIRRAQRGVAA